MSLLAPLGLVLLGVVAAVVLLHMRLRRTVRVPSLAIWRRIQVGQQRHSRKLGWPPMSWPLVLQVLAVVLAAVGLAQPVLNGQQRVDHWIFLLDHSLVMNTSGTGGSLLDDAKRQLTDRLGKGGGSDRVSIISIGAEAVPVVARQPANEPQLADAVASIAQEDGAAAWANAATVVRAVVQPGETTAVVVYSDEPVGIAGLPDGTITEAVVLPPATRANAALLANLLPDPSEPFRYKLGGSVRLEGGLGGTEVIVGYAAAGVGSSLEWTRQTVGRPDAQLSGEPVMLSFGIDLELPGPGVVSVSTSPDANPGDSSAWFVTSAEPVPVRVLYIGGGQQPLLTAIAAVDGTSVYQADGLPSDSASYDLVVVDNRKIARLPESNVIWIGDAGVAGTELTAGPSLLATSAMAEHPLLTGVDWAGIAVEDSFTSPADDGVTIVADSSAPLISAGVNGDGRSVRLFFDPRRSVWAQQSGLPVFAANLMRWLGLKAEGRVAGGCVVGERCRLDARLGGATIERLDRDEPSATLTSTDFLPSRAGLYRIVAGEHSRLLAVNPGRAERRISPPVDPKPAPFPVALWPWLLGGGLLVLVAEAFVAGRGSERFLHLSALNRLSPLRNRRRVVLGLRVATLALLLLAMLNVPMLLPRWGEAVAKIAAPGATVTTGIAVVAGPELRLGDDVPSRSGDTLSAIRLAAATLSWGEPGRVNVSGSVALSPVEAEALVPALLARGIALEYTALPKAPNDVAATALEAPSPLFAGDSFELAGVVHAAAAGPARVTLARDGVVLAEQDVELVAGDNRVDTLVPETAAGIANYELRVASAGDSVESNNTFGRTIEAREPGRVAVVAADEAQAAAFVGWLASQGLSGEPVLPIRAPYKPADWRAYDGAVLLDVPAIALTTQQQDVLKSAVADEGLGLLILGGRNTFGPGGYLETPLDDLSPLSSRVPRDMPEATLVFVLDRSGSMQQPVGTQTRLDVAKQATLAAVKLLNAQSKVGIIVFDAEATTILPLQTVESADAVAAAMSSVDPGGGTSIYPGLEAALDMLRGVDSPARHIVVMTDGLSQPADYPGLLARIRAEGITVSSVSIGKGAERELVAQIANLGQGTFHATDDFSALPSILSQEAMLLSGAPIEELRTQPLWASREEPFLRGLPDTMPPIDGFVLTTPKPEATLSLAVPDSKGQAMPLLASWRYGNGSVLALTTDAAGPWSAQWQQLPSYAALWSQALRQFLPPVDRGELKLSLAPKGDGVIAAVVTADGIVGLPTLTVAADTVPLRRVGPSRFEGVYYPSDTGALRFRAEAGEAIAEASFHANSPVQLRPSLRHDGLAMLAAATSGSPAEALRWRAQPLWQGWALVAVALLLAELVARYTGIIRPDLSVPLAPGGAGAVSNRRRRTVAGKTPVAA